MAFFVRRKLHRSGMKGRFFFKRARTDRATFKKAMALVRAAFRRTFGGAA